MTTTGQDKMNNIKEVFSRWPDLVPRLSEIPLFSSMSQADIHALLAMGEVHSLDPNTVLIKENDLENKLYILLQGHLIVNEGGSPIGEVLPISIVGEMGFFTTKPRNATVTSISSSVCISLSRARILKNPHFIQFITNIGKITTARWPNLVNQLAEVPIFNGMSPDEIHDTLSVGRMLFLGSNETLIKQGDHPSDKLYILLEGHLMVTVTDENGKEQFIAEISPISVVGEMGFFTENPRTANVYPARDSICIELSRDKILSNPHFIRLITNIARITTERVSNHQSMLSIYKRKIKTIALIPSGDFKEIGQFSKKFHEALQHLGTAFVHTEPAQPVHMYKEKFLSELRTLEAQYEYIIYVLGSEVTEWSTHCINQTDHVVFVAQERDRYDLSPLETFIFKEKKYIHRKELVLLRKTKSENTLVMKHFMNNRALDGYHNMADDMDDYCRITRCVTGKSTSLVLSGGGARGLAHIGVIRALLEKKIPIDMIGGTSMGSMIAAAYARYLNYDDFFGAIERFCFDYKFTRYTFPFISIFSGQDFTNGFKQICGEDTYIENLRRRYFCVACNLSRLELHRYTSGLLWSAVRASFAIPAILPPIIDEAGEILVDGCVMNNLPVDHMQALSNGGNIIASQVVQTGSVHRYEPCDGVVIGSHILLRKLNPFARKINLPGINFMFMKSMLISSQEHQLQMARDADQCISHNTKSVGLFEFKAMKRIVEVGYQNAIKQLEDDSRENRWERVA